MIERSRPANQDSSPSELRWRFVILVEIANFAMLRRHIGIDRVTTVAAEIIARLGVREGAEAHVAGRDLI